MYLYIMNNETYQLVTSTNHGNPEYSIVLVGGNMLPLLKGVVVHFEGTYRQCLGRFANIKKKEKQNKDG